MDLDDVLDEGMLVCTDVTQTERTEQRLIMTRPKEKYKTITFYQCAYDKCQRVFYSKDHHTSYGDCPEENPFEDVDNCNLAEDSKVFETEMYQELNFYIPRPVVD